MSLVQVRETDQNYEVVVAGSVYGSIEKNLKEANYLLSLMVERAVKVAWPKEA